MKKSIVKSIALTLVAVMMCLALVSCGLSGTYKNDGVFGVGATELTFSGSKVTITMGGVEAEGTYEIDDDKITITLDNAGDDALTSSDVLNGFNGEKDFEKGDDYIKIGGVKYTKAD